MLLNCGGIDMCCDVVGVFVFLLWGCLKLNCSGIESLIGVCVWLVCVLVVC